MKRLLYALTIISFCAGTAIFTGGIKSAAHSAESGSVRRLNGVWRGYGFSLSGSQSRVYAVFSKNASGVVEVQLFSPASPWASDKEALCSLRGAPCGRAVEFTNLSSRLPLEFRSPFYSNVGSSESGQIIKLSPEGGRLKFTFRKGGYAREQQEFSGYLDPVLN